MFLLSFWMVRVQCFYLQAQTHLAKIRLTDMAAVRLFIAVVEIIISNKSNSHELDWSKESLINPKVTLSIDHFSKQPPCKMKGEWSMLRMTSTSYRLGDSQSCSIFKIMWFKVTRVLTYLSLSTNLLKVF